jgi:prolyl-tRNA synthetase
MAQALPPMGKRPEPGKAMQTVDTPGQHSIEQVSRFLKVDPKQTVKTLLVKGTGGVIALVLRGDHELNDVKAAKLPQVVKPLVFVTPGEVELAAGCEPGSIGPVGLKIPVIADESAARLADFVCGANVNGKHLINVNWGRDAAEPIVADLRKVVDGDPCPDSGHGKCSGVLTIRRGIEVGHIFQLGTKYSESMNATYLDESGQSKYMEMGCYGIGVSRIVAAAIEQNNDARGILWPLPIAPFQVAIAPIGWGKNAEVRAQAEKLHDELAAAGIDVLLDDRDERPGVMFADLELIGVPHRINVGERSLKQGQVEYQARTEDKPKSIELATAVQFVKSLCGG